MVNQNTKIAFWATNQKLLRNIPLESDYFDRRSNVIAQHSPPLKLAPIKIPSDFYVSDSTSTWDDIEGAI